MITTPCQEGERRVASGFLATRDQLFEALQTGPQIGPACFLKLIVSKSESQEMIHR